MEKQAGFTLTEVLISLVIASIASLSLLKQTWSTTRRFNEVIHQSIQVNRRINLSEKRIFFHQTPVVSKRQCWGFSLSDVLISLALSTLILSILMSQYVSLKNSFTASHTLLSRQFDLQLIDLLLRESIHKAGFTPCFRIDQRPIWDSRVQKLPLKPIEFNKAQQLVIRRLNSEFVVLPLIESEWVITTPLSVSINPNHPVFIGDCEKGEIHEVSQVIHRAHMTEISLKRPLRFHYPSTVYLGRWIEERYFIKVQNAHKKALYYQEIHPEVLTDEINEMSVVIKEQAQALWVSLKLNNQEKGIMLPIDAMVKSGL